MGTGAAARTDGRGRSDSHQHTGAARELVVGADEDHHALAPAGMVLVRLIQQGGNERWGNLQLTQMSARTKHFPKL